MSAPDIQAVYAAAYTRLASATAGATVRAALGSTASVIPVEDLKKALPTLPLLAFQGGGLDTSEGDADDMAFTWWIYDSPLYGYRRIDGLVTLIRACYPHDWLANAFTRRAPSPEETPETPLAMNVRPITFIVSMRQ